MFKMFVDVAFACRRGCDKRALDATCGTTLAGMLSVATIRLPPPVDGPLGRWAVGPHAVGPWAAALDKERRNRRRNLVLRIDGHCLRNSSSIIS